MHVEIPKYLCYYEPLAESAILLYNICKAKYKFKEEKRNAYRF